MIIADRIEDGVVICVMDDVLIEIPVSNIDGGVREGDVLCAYESGDRYFVDAAAAGRRRQDISERFRRLKKETNR